MNFSPQKLVHVYYHGTGTKQLMGRLLLKDRTVFFEYDADFVKSGLELSPFKLPLKSGVVSAKEPIFEGLFGIFNDSLPDGWGRWLIDRKLLSLGLAPSHLSPLDRLCLVGTHGMGALSYEPEQALGSPLFSENLEEIAYEIETTLAEDDQYLDDLLTLSGSSAGARPKVLLRIEGVDWLIKFRASIDPIDIGPIEYAYHLMAITAGMNVPEAKLFPVKNAKKGLGFFGVKRFDRHAQQRIHMHTIAGLLHADHRTPSLDYAAIMKTTWHLTHNINQCEMQFRNAVFNVLSHNRDDHAKNFSFLMDAQGVWQVSPAYDLTFSAGPAGEHSTMVMGEGKNIKRIHLLKLAEINDINKEKALEIIEQVQHAVSLWPSIAEKVGVTRPQRHAIGKVLGRL